MDKISCLTLILKDVFMTAVEHCHKTVNSLCHLNEIVLLLTNLYAQRISPVSLLSDKVGAFVAHIINLFQGLFYSTC